MVSEGGIVVAQLPQADGSAKLRPVVLLKRLPGFGDYLACGVSTQLRQMVADFDLLLDSGAEGFDRTGLKATSVLRLTFLASVPVNRMKRRLGRISADQLETVQRNLARHVFPAGWPR